MARILVIDDEPSILSLVRRSLAPEPHEILEAADGQSALKFLDDHQVDLVITDLYMPGMDGIEFTIRLGQQKRHPKIIVMSGGGFMEKGSLLETARRLGANATLAKPFTVKELVDSINQLLGQGDPQ